MRRLLAIVVVLAIVPTTASAYYATGALIRNEARLNSILDGIGNHTWSDAWGYSSSGYYDAVNNWGWQMGLLDSSDTHDCYKFGGTSACSAYYVGWNKYWTGSSWYSSNAPWTTAGRQQKYYNNYANDKYFAYAWNGVCHTATNRGLYYYNVPWVDGGLDWAVAGAKLSYENFGHCGWYDWAFHDGADCTR